MFTSNIHAICFTFQYDGWEQQPRWVGDYLCSWGTMLHCDYNYTSVPIRGLIQLGQEDIDKALSTKHLNVLEQCPGKFWA